MSAREAVKRREGSPAMRLLNAAITLKLACDKRDRQTIRRQLAAVRAEADVIDQQLNPGVSP